MQASTISLGNPTIGDQKAATKNTLYNFDTDYNSERQDFDAGAPATGLQIETSGLIQTGVVSCLLFDNFNRAECVICLLRL